MTDINPIPSWRNASGPRQPMFPNLDMGKQAALAHGMTSAIKNGGKYAFVALIVDQLPVDSEAKKIVGFCFNSVTEYLAWCTVEGQQPSKITSMQKFALKTGGLKISATLAKDFSGVETTECIMSTLLAILSTMSNFKYAAGGPPGWVAYIGLILLDVIEIGNSCTPIQQGYYDLFLKNVDFQQLPKPLRRSYANKAQYVFPSNFAETYRNMVCTPRK